VESRLPQCPQIAGICLAGGHELVGRNVRDFPAIADPTIINPFK
jgi:predicted nucleic acid-binding protein